METAYSLAFNYIIKHSNYHVEQEYQSYEWYNILNVKTAGRNTDFIIASHVNKFMSYFCNSDAAKVQEMNYADVITDANICP